MENIATATEPTSERPLTSRQSTARARCTICRSEHRWRIELLKAGGASMDSLARKFNCSPDAIDRHWKNHVSPEMKAGYLTGPAQLQELASKAADTGASVLDHLHAVRTVLMGQMAAMVEASDGRGAAYIAGRLTSVLETIARISGELGDLARSTTTFNITNVAVLTEHPAFLKMQAAILRALGPHPAARADVVLALRALDSESAPAPAAGPASGHHGKFLELEPHHGP
jgi:hypothetical protein